MCLYITDKDPANNNGAFKFDPDFTIPFSTLSLSDKPNSESSQLKVEKEAADTMEIASDLQRVLFVKKSTRYADIRVRFVNNPLESII